MPNNGNDNTIKIILSKNGNKLVLIIADNGIGMPKDYKRTDSMGLELVDSLIKQIDGSIEFNNANGTQFKIAFKE